MYHYVLYIEYIHFKSLHLDRSPSLSVLLRNWLVCCKIKREIGAAVAAEVVETAEEMAVAVATTSWPSCRTPTPPWQWWCRNKRNSRQTSTWPANNNNNSSNRRNRERFKTNKKIFCLSAKLQTWFWVLVDCLFDEAMISSFQLLHSDITLNPYIPTFIKLFLLTY